jgi:hypothetical protein
VSIRAPVLDRLELADRPAELVPDPGVVRRRLHRPVGDAARFRREQRGGQRRDLGAGEAGQDPPGGHPELAGPDRGQRAGLVQAVQPGDGQVRGVDHRPPLVLPGTHGQDHQVGQACAEDRGCLAVEGQHVVADRTGQPGGQADGPGP